MKKGLDLQKIPMADRCDKLEKYQNNGSSEDDDLMMMTRHVDDCGERIPSQLRGSVVVIVTSEDIIMYIIIVYYCTPIGYVFPSFWDVIIVYVIEVNPLW